MIINILFLTKEEEPLFNQFKIDLRLGVLIEEKILTKENVDILATIFTKTITEKTISRSNIAECLQKQCVKYLNVHESIAIACADYCISMYNLKAAKLEIVC